MSAVLPASLPWREATVQVSPPAPESQPVQPNQGPPAGSPPRQLIVPDLIAAMPTGVTQAELAKIGKLGGVRAVLPLAGGQVQISGKPANVIGVSPQALRSWTPPQTAANITAWTSLANGDLLANGALPASSSQPASASQPASNNQPASSKQQSSPRPGTVLQVAGATKLNVPFGASAGIGIAGVDAVVDLQRSAQLGLIKNVAVLINAPGADLNTLMAQVRSVLGSHGKVVNLVQVIQVTQLPVAAVPIPAGQVPANYLMLYKESAAQYCPGLSWTVLAAIGEIESGDGANDGPSSAGALGPMQFMPGTWAGWGIDGFGQSGSPDIMNPLDAVPSAARMLCADGAGSSTGLSQAIFDYNHATWYVDEVLALAAEYAKSYS
jgi:Transglycosylase SLT domain